MKFKACVLELKGLKILHRCENVDDVINFDILMGH